MTFKMYIGDILIESIELCYDGLYTCAQKENYHSKLVNELSFKHKYKIAKSGEMPVFYIEGVKSKMNEKFFE